MGVTQNGIFPYASIRERTSLVLAGWGLVDFYLTIYANNYSYYLLRHQVYIAHTADSAYSRLQRVINISRYAVTVYTSIMHIFNNW